MRAKAAFLVGGLIGYVIGTRTGREQLDKITEQARRVWEDPKVQDAVSDATQRANAYVQQVAPEIRDMVTEKVRQAGENLSK